MRYKSTLSPKMQDVARLLTEEFPGMDHCITDSRRNLIVEVPKGECEPVRTFLKKHFQDVALIKNAYPLIEDLHDFILVKPLVSESPVYQESGVPVPELEKLLVDRDADREYAFLSEDEIQKEYQRAFELYTVDTSRLLRYAGRKGKKEEVRDRIRRIDQNRVAVIRSIQSFFQEKQVERVWIFGSFSRMEETPESDIDILVELDASEPVGLLQYAGMINALETLLHRKVDLVAKGSVKPFAEESINRDKVLVYERS